MLGLYRLATLLAGPLVLWHLRRRRTRGKEDVARFAERVGTAGRPRPPGPLIWLHAASVGESLSVLPLVERLLATRRDLHVMVTTGTVTSARLMAERLPERAFHQYVPVDRVAWVDRFLDHWRPDLALWAESELWPNLVMRAAARGVPLVLVNGRMSDRSFRRWRLLPSDIRRILESFDLCLGQSPEDARRLSVLGAPATGCLGNLKYASPPLPVDAAECDLLWRVFAERPLWLAVSTHPGEEALIGRVHRDLSRLDSCLLTVIVPRHPSRGDDIEADLDDLGIGIARRSRGEVPDGATGVYLADTLGETGLFFRLCPIVLVGKSLIGRGGQNPLEPARFGCTVLHGPHMDNFAAVAQDLAAAQGSVLVNGEAELRAALEHLLRSPNEVARMGMAARQVAEGKAGVLDALMNRLQGYLDALPGDGGAGA